MMRALAVFALVTAACAGAPPPVDLTGRWPTVAEEYDKVTERWTRRGELRDQYQEICEIAAVFKSPEWRASYASRDAYFRGLDGNARDARMAQAQAETGGLYEVELLVTTWDRRENDLDRGKKSIWRVVLIDEGGNEIEPVEIVKDKRPAFTVRADFPMLGDFATAYIARFPRDKVLLGDSIKRLRLHMSSVRGYVRLEWLAK